MTSTRYLTGRRWLRVDRVAPLMQAHLQDTQCTVSQVGVARGMHIPVAKWRHSRVGQGVSGVGAMNSCGCPEGTTVFNSGRAAGLTAGFCSVCCTCRAVLDSTGWRSVAVDYQHMTMYS